MRPPGWPEALAAYVDAMRELPWCWGKRDGSVSSRAFLAKYDDEQEISQAACRMPSAIWAALVNRERRAVAETVWL
jgi:hypothetical protein